MKKIFTFIGASLLCVILVGAVVFFGFEKNIPTDWVNGQIEEVKAYQADKIEEADKIPDGKIKFFYENLTYEEVDGKTVTTIASKIESSMKKSGSGDSFEIQTEITYYTDNGNTKTTVRSKIYKNKDDGKFYLVEGNEEPVEKSENYVISYYCETFAVIYDMTGEKIVIKDEIKNLIDNNLVSTSQKGLNIKLHMEKNTTLTDLSYNMITKKATGYSQVMKTYNSETLTQKTTTSVWF